MREWTLPVDHEIKQYGLPRHAAFQNDTGRIPLRRRNGSAWSHGVRTVRQMVAPDQPSATCRILLVLLSGTLSLSPLLVVASHSPPSGAGSTVRSRPNVPTKN